MLVFRVQGSFPSGLNVQHFTMDVLGVDEAAAKERLFSLIGSRHRANRRAIIIEDMTLIPPSDSSDPVVLHHFGTSSSEEEE